MENNKKVRNATRVEYDGIKFRSKLELFTYKELKKNNISFEYEKKTFVLMDKFELSGEKIRPITYTPDFTSGDISTWVIECKGFSNDVWPLKWKLFKRHLYTISLITKKSPDLYIVKNQKEVIEVIQKIKEKDGK